MKTTPPHLELAVHVGSEGELGVKGDPKRGDCRLNSQHLGVEVQLLRRRGAKPGYPTLGGCQEHAICMHLLLDQGEVSLQNGDCPLACSLDENIIRIGSYIRKTQDEWVEEESEQ